MMEWMRAGNMFDYITTSLIPVMGEGRQLLPCPVHFNAAGYCQLNPIKIIVNTLVGFSHRGIHGLAV